MPTLKNHLLGARLHNLSPDKKILSCLEGSNNKYLVIHSGSRHLGVEVCSYYQHLAYKISTKTGLIRKEIIE